MARTSIIQVHRAEMADRPGFVTRVYAADLALHAFEAIGTELKKGASVKLSTFGACPEQAS